MPRTDRGLLLRRVLAFTIDALVVVGATRPVVTRLARSREWRLLSTAGLAAVGGFPYHVLLEGTGGRTIGKAAAGIVVTSVDGDRPTLSAATVRTVLRLVDWLPIGYLLGLAAIAITDRDRRLGDLAAGTVVVHDE